MPVKLPSNPSALIQSCKQEAAFRGYTVFGIQHGIECWSGPNAANTYNKYGPSDKCNNGLGGAWANDVYRIHTGRCMKSEGVKEGRCSSSLLAAGRGDLRRTQLTRSSRRHIEGAAGCRLTTQCYGAQLRWKGWLSILLDRQPTLSTFQVGGNRSTRRKPTTFGRALTNSSHMSVASPN